MVSNAELKKKKEMAQAILENQNINMNAWYEEKYDQVIAENQEVIIEALSAYSKRNKPESRV
ncbi:hypothetical protein DT351_11185 (plasmid) [Latilactobacillus curvatus]|uniref:Uncharacterized protein n=1 Tax=Latilactobacillus curvatus TaxID=28038 RepID=A0A385AH77_LATCU|nr:hypothetical protein [Latilactobacillus curvatus]AXN36904.1 hypothetical protein DT351_11185 [Latilactobacillus curvatus]